ncbi:hypothetical protein E3E35_02530 [Thermococcus sp. GR7]|uniref:hypothetical protein n=1 Tax=unclassified Thermococcus TaxID=2627626 RepID=UPI00142F4B69|nr:MULTISPECIES: hypothetical protein [unclassified Thermococcus]NJE46308.1 hypothetical protein [Thermococcus sp. GR7]NJE79291.1 hypothetical protein [Thermococcus sp. GR4]NJF23813.1 hypothetical protein [Thermococcus sp. GR5]
MESGEELKFTGNWFIDAGILGFVNLMEEVYGWDLEELQRRIKEEPEKVYYGYFPLAYFYKLSGSKKRDVRIKALQAIEQSAEQGKELLEKVWWNFIVEAFKDKWVTWKLGKMHEKEILDDKKGKLKPEYNDEKYRELIRRREEALNKLKECEGFIQSILGKRKKFFEKGKHKFTLEDLESTGDTILQYREKPDDCLRLIEEVLKIHKELKEYLESLWESVRVNQGVPADKSRFFRIPVDSGFYKNYLFFNYSRGILEQLEDTWNLIKGNAEYSEYLSKIDKTLSKFLPSDSEFPNISYTPLRVVPLLEHLPHLFVYLLNFLNAFTFVPSVGYVFFYSGDLEFTYYVNKKLKTFVEQASKEDNKNINMFKVTWQVVIDVLVDYKSKWALENMYLVQYRKVQQQDLIGVKYIGIPKLHASILLDDQIREALNTSLSVNGSKVWPLEEFLRQRPLYPVITKHVWNGIKNNGSIRWRASLYALAIDAKLKSIGNDSGIFGDFFFKRPTRAVVEVKEYYQDMSQSAWSIRKAISEKNIIHPLFSALRRHNRNAFVNILLKALLQANDKKSASWVNSYIFRRILNNDSSWEDFALALVVGLAGGGEDVSSGGEPEE